MGMIWREPVFINQYSLEERTKEWTADDADNGTLINTDKKKINLSNL